MISKAPSRPTGEPAWPPCGLVECSPRKSMMLGSESAQRFELVLLLVAAVIPLEILARRIRMPSAATLLLGGIMLALIPGTPDLTMDPEPDYCPVPAALAAG